MNPKNHAIKYLTDQCHARIALQEFKAVMLKEFPLFKLAKWILNKLVKE